MTTPAQTAFAQDLVALARQHGRLYLNAEFRDDAGNTVKVVWAAGNFGSTNHIHLTTTGIAAVREKETPK